jgi:glycerol kinase
MLPVPKLTVFVLCSIYCNRDTCFVCVFLDSTARGAAYFAGLNAGFWKDEAELDKLDANLPHTRIVPNNNNNNNDDNDDNDDLKMNDVKELKSIFDQWRLLCQKVKTNHIIFKTCKQNLTQLYI